MCYALCNILLESAQFSYRSLIVFCLMVLLFLLYRHGFVLQVKKTDLKCETKIRRKDKVGMGIERDTLNCFKCELFRVRGVRDKEKQLIVSHEVSLAALKSPNQPTAKHSAGSLRTEEAFVSRLVGVRRRQEK